VSSFFFSRAALCPRVPSRIPPTPSTHQAQSPAAGQGFQDRALDGGRLNLADFKGKVVFLNLWATWCGPCKEEMPAMERLWQRYKGEGLVVIALSMDSGERRSSSPTSSSKYTYRIGLDPKMEIAQLYGAHSVPSTFIIDRNGALRAIALGPPGLDGRAPSPSSMRC